MPGVVIRREEDDMCTLYWLHLSTLAAVCRTAVVEAVCSDEADLDAIAGLRHLEPPAVR